MPHVGRQYLFFLKRVGEDHYYHILTGYELRGGSVSPLDGAKHTGGGKKQFDAYEDENETAFLTKVHDKVKKVSQ